ncbi:MAG: LysR family transcriptional regulator [Pseudomonadota bacterium]
MNQVRYFLAVCEHRNFTRAAKASFVSQPSLTTAIKKLEDELGGPLFLRDRAGCRLTPLGLIMQPHLEAITHHTREARAEATRHVRLDRVPVRVGIGETIGPRRLTPAIELFRVDNPKVDIELIVEREEDVLDGLRRGDFDLGIASSHVNDALFKADLIYEESYRLVVNAEHPLARESDVHLADLSHTNILDRPNCEMRATLHSECDAQSCPLYASYRSNRVDWLLSLVRQGSGAAVLPETAIPEDRLLVALVLQDFDEQRRVSAVRDRQQPARPETDELVRRLLKAAS